MVFTSQKISCPLARISPFLDCLLLISTMVSTSSKIALTKKILFPLSRKSVCTSRMKDIQNYVSTTRKKCFFIENLWKNRKKRCPLARVWFILKNRLSLISLIVSISRKNSEWKKKCFLQTKYSFPLARVKDWLKNMIQLKEKLLPLATVDCYLRKWKKMFSTCQFALVKIWSLASTYISDSFHYEEKLWTKESGFIWLENPFSLAGIKDFVKTNTFPLDGKKLVTTKSLWE